MGEAGEGNPASNFQKTVMAQKERTENATESEYPGVIGLVDKMIGKQTHGFLDSEYEAGKGGTIRTEIQSGRAQLLQSWIFDKDGKLSSVKVIKLLASGGATVSGDMGNVVLERDESGKFQVRESSSSNLGVWEREFNKADKRIQAHKNIPVNTSPKSPQPQK